MALLSGLGRKISTAANSSSKLKNLGSSGRFTMGGQAGVAEAMSNPYAIGAVGAAAFGYGMTSVAGPAAMDATMVAAFGDPNVDRYFMGNDLSFRYFAGAAMGGPLGSMMKFSAPEDYFRENPAVPSPAGAVAGGMVLGGALGLGTTALAAKFTDVGLTKAGIAGMAVAGIVGAGASASGAVMPVVNYRRANADFFGQSPYSTSRANAANLGASGDIVLGMHNSRRGY